MKKQKKFINSFILVFLLSNVLFAGSEILKIKSRLILYKKNTEIKELNLKRNDSVSDTGIKDVQLLKEPDQVEAFYYFSMAKAYQQDKLIDKAIESYKLAINANPCLDSAYNKLGLIYAEKGDYKNSAEVFKKYLNLSDNSDEDELIRVFINKIKAQSVKY